MSDKKYIYTFSSGIGIYNGDIKIKNPIILKSFENLIKINVDFASSLDLPSFDYKIEKSNVIFRSCSYHLFMDTDYISSDYLDDEEIMENIKGLKKDKELGLSADEGGGGY